MGVCLMEKLLEAFSLTLRERNKIRNIVLHLRKHGKTVDDFLEYTLAEEELRKKKIAENEKHQKKYEATLLPCLDCATPMIPRPVNTDPGNQTGDNSTKVHTCMNPECMHQIFE